MEKFPESPFKPAWPVDQGSFKEHQKILRQMPKVINQGKMEHYFVIGKKGADRTSFVKYVTSKVIEQFQMIPIYVNNDGTNSLDHLIKSLLEALFAELGKKIVSTFADDFEEMSSQGHGFKLKDKSPLVENVKCNFKEFLIDLVDKLEDKSGIFIIIDDINGLSEDEHFTSWYKGFTDAVSFYDYKMPVAFTLVGDSDEFDKLCLQNESFSRIFNLIEIDGIEDGYVVEFPETHP